MKLYVEFANGDHVTFTKEELVLVTGDTKFADGCEWELDEVAKLNPGKYVINKDNVRLILAILEDGE